MNRWLPKDHAKFDAHFQNAAEAFLDGTPLTRLHLKALAAAESSLRPEAASPAGALGLMQLMPATGAEMGLRRREDFFDPEANIFAGARYLRRMWEFFRLPPPAERFCFAVAAYNAGAGNVLKAQARAAALGYPKDDFLGVAATLPSVTFDHARETLHHVARVKRIYAELSMKNEMKI